MGVCLSCLGIRGRGYGGDDPDRSRLLYDDYPGSHGYGTWGASNLAPQNLMSPEEVQREQEALDSITRWASDQIVEIFPHQHRTLAMSTSQLNGHTNDHTAASAAGAVSSANTHQHQDILLSLIPGDKSKRSIRIYPASRPTSKASLRSNSSMSRLNGAGAGSVKVKNAPVLVTLDVNLP